MTNKFAAQFQNSRTEWEWKDAVLIADEDSFGLEFDDEFIVPDITPAHPFFSWTNFRVFCSEDCDKINLWASVHSFPNQTDISGRLHQSGDAASTYADYETISGVFKNSNRFYFWIQSTGKDENHTLSQDIFDPSMSKAVTRKKVFPDAAIGRVSEWIGWDPIETPDGLLPYALKVSENSSKSDVARWIMGWDNACVNVRSNAINPLLGFSYQAGILDSYRSIEGLTGKHWLGCPAGHYFYGKVLYCLENHDGPQRLVDGTTSLYRLLDTVGFKSCQINIAAIKYGGAT